MTLFRYREDRRPVFFSMFVLLADIAVYLTVENPLVLLLYFGIGILPKASICAHNHHHQHVYTFYSSPLNRLLELVYGLQTGAFSNAWVLHHSLGHHVTYLDQEKDESRWKRDDGTTMSEFEYSFVVTLTAYTRAWAVGARYPRQRRQFLLMGILTFAVMVALVAYRPVPGLFIFVLAPAFSLWGTAWATYAHHTSRSTENHFVASNNMIHTMYNYVTCNLGYHTAHHYKPGVHWSRLPALHDEIAHLIPADAYVRPGIPWRYLAPAYYPSVDDVARLSARAEAKNAANDDDTQRSAPLADLALSSVNEVAA